MQLLMLRARATSSRVRGCGSHLNCEAVAISVKSVHSRFRGSWLLVSQPKFLEFRWPDLQPRSSTTPILNLAYSPLAKPLTAQASRQDGCPRQSDQCQDQVQQGGGLCLLNT